VSARTLLAALLAAASVLAACGDGGADETATESQADDSTSAADLGEHDGNRVDREQGTVSDAATSGDTFAFEHVAGTTQVPVDPQRIVTLQDQNALLPLLELGVRPIASAALDNGDGTHTFRRVDNHDVEGIGFVGPYGEPDLELIAAQQPDLIIGGEFDEPIYDQLSQIAPTVLIQIFGRPLPDALEDFAAVVGEEERHAELVADYEAAVADLVADLPRPPDQIELSVIAFSGDGTFYTEIGQALGTVLDDVGFARPEAEAAAIADPDYSYAESLERLSTRDGDVLLSPDYSSDTGGDEAPEIAEVRSSAVFQGLDVVQRGEFHVFDGGEMVGSAFEKMTGFLDFLRSILIEREPNLAATG
jgi:iron complex transport system substrate-binding protein